MFSRPITPAPLFQSTPGIAAGRIKSAWLKPCQSTVFQSTPGIAAGRIRAWPSPAATQSCFNPRPALLPGESIALGAGAHKNDVSIHARHCCRANRPHPALPGLGATSFNPRPALLPGESLRSWWCPGLRRCFNPRPALLPGESLPPPQTQRPSNVSIHARHCCRANRQADVPSRAGGASFNPRPALLPGESRERDGLHLA